MKMNQKTKQKEESRAAIQASAAVLLHERGIKASSVIDVMRGAGLTVGGFYNHFNSKEDLFVGVMRDESHKNWNNLLKSAKGDSPKSRTLSVIRSYLSRKHRDSKEEGCLLPSTVQEVAQVGEPYRSALEQELSNFIRSFAQMIDAGPESRQTALGLLALMYGALSLSQAVAGTRLSEEFLQAGRKLAQQVVAE
jgi:TetR/AcrR family transcriptional repressor of nem operon